MVRDIKRVRDRVPVLPTMAASPTAPETPGNAELTPSARQDVTPGGSRNATARPSDASVPIQASATDRPTAAARRALRSEAEAVADNEAQNQELTELRRALQQTEWQSEAYQEQLAQERDRNRALEEQLAARRDATLGRGRNTTASLSDAPYP